MANLPEATVTIDDEAGAFAGPTGYAVVVAPVATSADTTPRVYASTASLLDQHDYAPGVGYTALHIEKTKLPILFVGIPVATAGAVTHTDTSAVTGTCKISVAAGPSGILEEVDGIVEVSNGGTVGTSSIVISLSCDGGRTYKTVRLGTATTYTIPYLGIVLSFASGGTLVTDDVYRFRTSAPMWDNTGLTAARVALAAQQKLARSFVIVGEVPTDTFATYVTTQVNAYETANDRFVYARVNIKDRLPLPKMSKAKWTMSGSPSVTFAEVGGTGDTITRATGSFVTDGAQVGDRITVSGTASNNFTDAKITAVTATVLTLDTQDLVAEVTTAATIVGSPALVFAEVGATGDTITRTAGSFVTEGYVAGDLVTVSGTASNNFTSAAITAVSATVLTLDTQDLVAEEIASHRVTIEKALTKSAWIAAADTEFESVDAQKRIDIAAGRLRKLCPITGWMFRRPVAWAASIREYEHDLHIANWRKSDGPLDGWDIEDDDGNIFEFDERVDGGALAARFTCARTWANGPSGAYIAKSITRQTEGSLLSLTTNMAVANLACTITQAETENAIGVSLVLDPSTGKATEESLAKIEERVNSALELNLLQNREGEGQRASKATWKASRNDVLNVAEATINGTLTLLFNGIVERINTRVRIQTNGA
jgi:hypothetical protein